MRGNGHGGGLLPLSEQEKRLLELFRALTMEERAEYMDYLAALVVLEAGAEVIQDTEKRAWER